MTSTSSGERPSRSDDDLRQHRLVALALRDIGGDGDSAERIDVHRRHDTAPFFGPACSRASRGHHGREIAHVRHGRLDDGRRSRCRRCGRRRAPHRAGVSVRRAGPRRPRSRLRADIAGIIKRAGRGPVRKFLRRYYISPDDVERIEFQLDRDAPKQPLQRQIKLRTTEAANELAGISLVSTTRISRPRWRCRRRR